LKLQSFQALHPHFSNFHFPSSTLIVHNNTGAGTNVADHQGWWQQHWPPFEVLSASSHDLLPRDAHLPLIPSRTSTITPPWIATIVRVNHLGLSPALQQFTLGTIVGVILFILLHHSSVLIKFQVLGDNLFVLHASSFYFITIFVSIS